MDFRSALEIARIGYENFEVLIATNDSLPFSRSSSIQYLPGSGGAPEIVPTSSSAPPYVNQGCQGNRR